MIVKAQIPAYSGDFRRLAMVGYGSIAVAFGGFGLWASLAPLDSAAIASAQVAIATNRKPIQHLEGGILSEVLIKESQRVEAGQVLFRLQPIQAQSSADLLRKQLDGAFAKEARLLAERDQKASIEWPAELVARREIAAVASSMADQEKEFLERRRSLESQIAIHKTRIEQTSRDIAGKKAHENSLSQQSASLLREIGAVSGLADKGFFPRNKLAALQRDQWRLEGDLGVVRGDIARAGETIEESRQQIALVRQQRVEEAAQQLGEAKGRKSELREKLSIASDVLSRIDVRSPRAGIVQGIKVHTVGEIVRPGDTIAEVVTPEEGLIMTAQVTPQDIDMVAALQGRDPLPRLRLAAAVCHDGPRRNHCVRPDDRRQHQAELLSGPCRDRWRHTAGRADRQAGAGHARQHPDLDG